MVNRYTLFFMVGFLCLITSLVSCKARNGSSSLRSEETASGDWWAAEKAERTKAYADYLKEHESDFLAYRDTSVGYSGIPLLAFRLFPEIFPEIWGMKNKELAPMGLLPHPDKSNPLPLGFGTFFPPPLGLTITNVACSMCHSSRVKLADNSYQYLYGAPANEADLHAIVYSFSAVAANDKFNFKTFAEYIDPAGEKAKPRGFFLGRDKVEEEDAERKKFLEIGEELIKKVKMGFMMSGAQSKAILGAIYNSPTKPSSEGGHPGSIDAMGMGIAKITTATQKSLWHKKAAFVDHMSIWRQDDRSNGQWTGSMKHPVYRNLGAELGVVGDPKMTNYPNSIQTTRLLTELPPPVYPFPVDSELAAKGRKLFSHNCAGCHYPGNEKMYAPEFIGVSSNRVEIFNPTTRRLMIDLLREACVDPTLCKDIPDDDILGEESGYMAQPLDGIWARAPYLHNGSIPTLRHFLVPEMRRMPNATKFWRGNPTYDTKNVGFVWDKKEAETAKQYDTSLEGFSNKGHTGYILKSDGGKWAGEELEQLLEFMKTL